MEKKVDNVVKKIFSTDIPIKLFSSITYDIYRKPLPGFMNIIENQLRIHNIKINIKKSFYCGDAAGRPKDHSRCDRKFAINAGLEFILPEKLFDKNNILLDEIIYQPFNELQTCNKNKKFDRQNKEMIIMVGCPGSGKSHYVTSTLVPLEYSRVNQDILRTKQKCLKETTKLLNSNKNIIIDNTNPDKDTRTKYIGLAKEHNYKIRCIIMDVGQELARHNMTFRAYKTNTKCIPMIVYRIYNKKYQQPTLNEGFNEIIKIKPNIAIDDPAYKMYLI